MTTIGPDSENAQSPPPPKMTCITVVPAYNEVDGIRRVITSLRNIDEKLDAIGVHQSIYVIDDGSGDGTADAAEEAGADRVFRHRTNLGLGAAVRTGLTAARNEGADIAVKLDADFQHDSDDILSLIQPILSKESNIVYGNRFSRIQYRMPLVRRVGNIVFTKLMRRLTGWPLYDSQPGMFAADRAYLREFFLPGDYNYTQQILLDAYHKGFQFSHVDITFRKRTSGKSFISFRYPFRVFLQIIMIIVSIKPMIIFAPIGLFILFVSACISGYQLFTYINGASDKPIQSVNLVLGTSFVGLQTFFFGILAELIIRMKK